MRIVFWSYFFVAVGGALGAMARFALNVFLQRDIAFPWGTLSANLLGCLAMGIIAELVASASRVHGQTPKIWLSAAYDKDMADAVYTMYEEDFEEFEYARDSWLFA